MIKAVVFDLWNTLFYDDVKKEHPFTKFARKIGRDIDDYSYLKIFEKHVMTSKSRSLDLCVKNLLKELKISYDDKLVLELTELLEKKNVSQKPYPDTLNFLKKLRARKYKIGLITNVYHHSFEKLNQEFKLTKIFDVILTSYETGMIKPDPKIFDLMLKRLGVSKNEVLMIGDSPEDDVQAAEKVGIRAVLLDRKGRYPDYPGSIRSLRELRLV